MSHQSVHTMPGSNSLSHYYLFFYGQQISSFGSALVSFAIIWYVTLSTSSAFFLALASIASISPMMLVQPISGYITDHFNRKFILIGVDLGQALATLLLIVIFILQLHTIWWIISLLFIRGIFDGIHRPVKGAIIPTMVPKKKLQQINSLDSTFSSIIQLFSPALGALLLVVFASHFWLILTIDVFTFLIALIPLLIINIPDVTTSTSSSEISIPFKTKFFAGYSYIKSTKGLLPLLTIFALFNFFVTPASMLLPLIILTEVGFDASEFIYASVLIVFHVGFLLMSTFLTKYKLDLKPATGVFLGFSISIVGLFSMTYSLFIENLLYFVIGEVLIGMSFPIVNVFSSIIWQTQVPPKLQGRVISVRVMVSLSTLPVVMLLIGIIATSIPISMIFIYSTIGFLVSLSVIWYFTDFKLLNKSEIERSQTILDSYPEGSKINEGNKNQEITLSSTVDTSPITPPSKKSSSPNLV